MMRQCFVAGREENDVMVGEYLVKIRCACSPPLNGNIAMRNLAQCQQMPRCNVISYHRPFSACADALIHLTQSYWGSFKP